MAFVSDESGNSEIYVVPIDAPGARRVASIGGGISPRWRGDGRELFYLAPGRTLMSVDVGATAGLTLGEPRTLFPLPAPVYQGIYDVAPDGQTILVNHVLEDVSRAPIGVVLGWVADADP